MTLSKRHYLSDIPNFCPNIYATIGKFPFCGVAIRRLGRK